MITLFKGKDYTLDLMPSLKGTIRIKINLNALTDSAVTDETRAFAKDAEVHSMAFQEGQVLGLNLAVSMEMIQGRMNSLSDYMRFQTDFQMAVQKDIVESLTDEQRQAIKFQQQQEQAKMQGGQPPKSTIVTPSSNPMTKK